MPLTVARHASYVGNVQLVMPLRSANCAHHGNHGRAALGRTSASDVAISVARAKRTIRMVVIPSVYDSVGSPAAFQALSPPAR